MYNIAMNSKLITKLLNYAKTYGFNDLSITKHQDHHILWGDDGLDKTQIKLPLKLERDLSLAFKQLLKIAPDDLLSGAYFKTGEHNFLISIIPHEDGEKIIIKRINKEPHNLKLSKVGLERSNRRVIEHFMQRGSGLVIVASPDNEGKTTTVSALLDKINLEDKIGYLLEESSELERDGLNKIKSLGEKRLVDLENLRRHDANVIVIDDASSDLLRNGAELAQQGKLVIIGIKAESLIKLNQIIANLNQKSKTPTLVIFQKLLAKNCPHCLKPDVSDEINSLVKKYWPDYKKYVPTRFWMNRGCKRCNYSGKKGLMAVFSIMLINESGIEKIQAISADILQKAVNGLISINKFLQKQSESLSQRL
jgi:type II secretory ATPase GspE/PulE/Tfp pilus assembly ATPase PilB-like protein